MSKSSGFHLDGSLVFTLFSLFRTIKTEIDNDTEKKLTRAASLIENIIYVMKHPGMEALIYSNETENK